MPYALELLLDPAATARVKALCDRLDDKGLRPSRAGDPELPHLSLLVAQTLAPEQIIELLAGYQFGNLPPVWFYTVDTFKEDAGVLFLAPHPTSRLRAFHRALFDVLEGVLDRTWIHYQPLFFVPHVTLADGLTQSQIKVAKDTIGTFDPILAKFTDVIIVEVDGNHRFVREHIQIPGRDPATPAWADFERALAHQQYFLAHEVLETLWRHKHQSRQQAAIWLAAFFIHEARANLGGAHKMLDKLQRYQEQYSPELQDVMSKWRVALNENRPIVSPTPYERFLFLQWAHPRRE